MRTFLPIVILGGLLLGGAARLAAESEEVTVGIDNFSFLAADITVPQGTTITWTNHDDIPHTVTDAGQPRGFKSAALDTGDQFRHVFLAPGTYHYFCSLHPHMQGTVIVK